MADAMTITVTEDIGEVKLGDTVLPGIYQSLEVSRAVRMDEAKVPGRSGATKQPMGFEDAEITLALVLASDLAGSARAKLQTIAGLFQAQDKLARPYVYTVAHPLLAAWGIRHVVFQQLKSRDDNLTDLIYASLRFVEHVPVTVKKERRRKPQVLQTTVSSEAVPQGLTLYEASDVLGVNPYSVPFAEVGDFMLLGTGTSKNIEAAGMQAAVDDDQVS